jgi:hypothetical protein
VLVLAASRKNQDGENQEAMSDVFGQGAGERLAIRYLPSKPPADRDEWHHGLIRTLLEILTLLKEGHGVMYLCTEGKNTAAFLPAALSILGDPEVHPHKALYPLQASGLGLNPYQYGVVVGMGERGWDPPVSGRFG